MHKCSLGLKDLFRIWWSNVTVTDLTLKDNADENIYFITFRKIKVSTRFYCFYMVVSYYFCDHVICTYA